MIKLNLTINPIKSLDSNLNSFIIEPLNIGQGITLGNSLRNV